MPRLTAELIASAPAYMNPLNERELNLRSQQRQQRQPYHSIASLARLHLLS